MVDDSEIVWERVCVLANNAGKGPKEISEDSGVPLTTVKRFFNGETKNPGFLSLCQMIYALGGSVDEIMEIDREGQPCRVEGDGRYSRQLEKDLRYERRSKMKIWAAFMVLVAINVGILLFDLFNPYIGYIRYQRQIAAYGVEQAFVALCAVLGRFRP